MNLIAAIDAEGGIAKGGRIPWLSEVSDLRHFREQTRGAVCIMGRSTAAGIADRIEGVDGRRVLVLTTRAWRGPGVRCTSRDPHEIADAARELAGDAPIYVCGGAQTYALMMPVVTRAVITRIPWSYGCNLHLPSLAGLRVTGSRIVRSDNGSHGLTCYEYRRNG